MIISLPLELAAASAKMDAHWLRKRKRKHWWKREQFPRVRLPSACIGRAIHSRALMDSHRTVLCFSWQTGCLWQVVGCTAAQRALIEGRDDSSHVVTHCLRQLCPSSAAS